ncbi:MAG TPA: hypothetical protein VGL93_25200 [Streptosporangiaceae bacterium]
MLARRRLLTAAAIGTAALYAVVWLAENHPAAVAARWAGLAAAVAALVATHWWPRRDRAAARPRRHILLRILAFLGGWVGGVLAMAALLAAVFVSSPTWLGIPALVAVFAVAYAWLAEVVTFWGLAALIAPHAVAAYETARDIQELPRDVRDVREAWRRRGPGWEKE